MVTLAAGGELWPHLGATGIAAFAGLLIGLGLGISLGFAAALSPMVAELLEPVMILLNAIPRVILAPLLRDAKDLCGIGVADEMRVKRLAMASHPLKRIEVRLEKIRTGAHLC